MKLIKLLNFPATCALLVAMCTISTRAEEAVPNSNSSTSDSLIVLDKTVTVKCSNKDAKIEQVENGKVRVSYVVPEDISELVSITLIKNFDPPVQAGAFVLNTSAMHAKARIWVRGDSDRQATVGIQWGREIRIDLDMVSFMKSEELFAGPVSSVKFLLALDQPPGDHTIILESLQLVPVGQN